MLADMEIIIYKLTTTSSGENNYGIFFVSEQSRDLEPKELPLSLKKGLSTTADPTRSIGTLVSTPFIGQVYK
jgi:hypothetical protein